MGHKSYATARNGQAVRTDAEIAAELARRHIPGANNAKNVAVLRKNAERKLRKALGKLADDLGLTGERP